MAEHERDRKPEATDRKKDDDKTSARGWGYSGGYGAGPGFTGGRHDYYPAGALDSETRETAADGGETLDGDA